MPVVQSPLNPEFPGPPRIRGPDELALKAVEQGVIEHRKTLNLVFTCFVFLAYAGPSVITMHMAFDPDVAFWLGRVGVLTVLLPLLFLVQYGVHESRINNPKSLRFIMFWTATIPAIWFCSMGGVYMNEADYTYDMIHNSGCEGVKGDLQDAYNKALSLQAVCVNRMIQENGGKPLPGLFVPVITLCEEYQDVNKGELKTYWNYLAHAEVNHVCSGMCEGGPALWSGTGTRHGLPCGRHIAQKMLIVKEQAVLVLVSGVLMVAGSLSVYLLAAPMLKQLGYMPID